MRQKRVKKQYERKKGRNASPIGKLLSITIEENSGESAELNQLSDQKNKSTEQHMTSSTDKPVSPEEELNAD